MVKIMVKFLAISFSIFSLLAPAQATPLVVLNDPTQWNEESRIRLFKTVFKHSILSDEFQKDKVVVAKYLASKKSEKDFIKDKITEMFPGLKVTVEDVPETVANIATLHKDVFGFFPKKFSEESELWKGRSMSQQDKWNETDKKTYYSLASKMYFQISKEALSAVHQAGSYLDACKLLLKDSHTEAKKVVDRIKDDFDSPPSLLKRGLELEAKAINDNEIVWFRGSGGAKLPYIGQTLDCPIHETSIENYHFMSQKDRFENLRALSFGTSLLAGHLLDEGACTFSFLKNGISNFGYALKFKKTDFVKNLIPMINMPNLPTSLGLLGYSEHFHPRFKGPLSNGCIFLTIPYEPGHDYKAQVGTMLKLLKDNTTLIWHAADEKKKNNGIPCVSNQKNVVTETSHKEQKQNLRKAHEDLLKYETTGVLPFVHKPAPFKPYVPASKKNTPPIIKIPDPAPKASAKASPSKKKGAKVVKPKKVKTQKAKKVKTPKPKKVKTPKPKKVKAQKAKKIKIQKAKKAKKVKTPKPKKTKKKRSH